MLHGPSQLNWFKVTHRRPAEAARKVSYCTSALAPSPHARTRVSRLRLLGGWPQLGWLRDMWRAGRGDATGTAFPVSPLLVGHQGRRREWIATLSDAPLATATTAHFRLMPGSTHWSVPSAELPE